MKKGEGWKDDEVDEGQAAAADCVRTCEEGCEEDFEDKAKRTTSDSKEHLIPKMIQNQNFRITLNSKQIIQKTNAPKNCGMKPGLAECA